MEKILNSVNLLLEDDMKIEELDRRLETLIISTPVASIGEVSDCDDYSECDATACDDFTCPSTTM